MRKYFHAVAAIMLCCIAFTPNAHAYIDPGTGTMLLQALAAGFVALMVFWRRIHAGLTDFFSKNKTDTEIDLLNDDKKDDA